jgi:hypothetical protein
VIEFIFDENVPGQQLSLTDWRVYTSTGVWANPTDASISGNRVLARFTPAQVSSAALATARYGAVEDATGVPNIEGDAALQPASVTTPAFPAQLKRVDNYRLSGQLIGGFQRILIDFTFDDDIADPAGANAHNLPLIGDPSGIFYLIGAAGQVYDSFESCRARSTQRMTTSR